MALLKSSTPPASPPHLVFIMVDDMGWNDFGPDSTDMAHASKYLYELAAKGVLLTRYYTQQSCTPARAAFLTGRYPSHCGMGYDTRGSFSASSPYGVPLEYKLIPQYLKDFGYRTTIVGKWNVGHFSIDYLPHHRGFDSALTFQSDQIHYYNYTATGLPKSPTDMLFGQADGPFEIPFSLKGYTTDMFTSRAINMIELVQDDSRPLFLYLAYQAVHVPHETPPTDLYSTSDEWKLENVTDMYRKRFGMTLVALDKSVRRVFDTIEAVGILDSTFLVVTSDNGGCPSDGSNNYPLRGGKFDVFEGGVRVPAFVYSRLLPDSIVGTSFHGLWHVTDWLPTLIAVASNSTDVDLPQGLDGVNQLPFIVDEKKGGNVSARSEILLGMNRWDVRNDVPESLPFKRAMAALIWMHDDGNGTTRAYKFIQNQVRRSWYDPATDDARECTCGIWTQNSENWLFDLDQDPNERTNLLTTLENISHAMSKKVLGYYNVSRATSWKQDESTVAEIYWALTSYLTPWHRPGSESDMFSQPSPPSNTSD